jgi:hypothetical protein
MTPAPPEASRLLKDLRLVLPFLLWSKLSAPIFCLQKSLRGDVEVMHILVHLQQT